jgi:hypothetical protein
MPSDLASFSTRSERLTLGRIMGAAAGVAVGFAFLPWLLSVPVAVLGIFVLGGIRVPLVKSGSGARRWLPWVLWSMALAACPVSITVVGALYEYQGPPIYDRFAKRVVDGLSFAHLWVSVIASIAVMVLTRGSYRWLGWAVVVAVAMLTFVLYFGAAMATTGAYL